MEGTLIRPILPNDIDSVLAVQAASPDAAQWDRQSYEAIPAGWVAIRCLVAELHGEIAAFVCFRTTGRESELLNLAVRPSCRRRGIASLLLDKVLQESAGTGADVIYLEVRSSNVAGNELYRKCGFKLHAVHEGYYDNPPADAWILRLRLPAGKEVGSKEQGRKEGT